MQEQEEDLLLELDVGGRLITVIHHISFHTFIASHTRHAWYLLFKEYL